LLLDAAHVRFEVEERHKHGFDTKFEDLFKERSEEENRLGG